MTRRRGARHIRCWAQYGVVLLLCVPGVEACAVDDDDSKLEAVDDVEAGAATAASVKLLEGNSGGGGAPGNYATTSLDERVQKKLADVQWELEMNTSLLEKTQFTTNRATKQTRPTGFTTKASVASAMPAAAETGLVEEVSEIRQKRVYATGARSEIGERA
eukprot:3339720-Pleurochrysis_carterae.AAC.1